MSSSQIEVIPAAELDASVRAEILALCSDAYEEDFTPYLDLLSQAVHVLLRVDGKLVGHAAWVARQLYVENLDQPLRAAYVEAVAVPTALQGRGYGRTVMSALPALFGEFDIAALSPSEVPFYESLGWELWQGPLSYLHEGGEFIVPDEEVMILRLAKTPAALDTLATLTAEWRPGDVW